MELVDFIRSEFDAVHRMLGQSMQDLDDEILHWHAGGTTNTIAQLLAHVVTGQDLLIADKLGGGKTLHESGWAEKTGIPLTRTDIWLQRDAWHLNLDAFNDFRLAVEANSRAYVEALRPSDLDLQRAWIRGPEQPIGTLLQNIFINHALGHCGEISTLKGLRGLKGLPI
jgi:uncharacterized damage-inducible protein DinB